MSKAVDRCKAAAAALVVVSALLAPGAALAVSSRNGSDVSTDFNGGHQIKTCDKESDSEQVHSDGSFTNVQWKNVIARDADGNNGQCASSGYDRRVLRQHRTCEERDFAPDECGNWAGTGR